MLISIEAVPTEQLQVNVSIHTNCEDIGQWPVSGLKSLATDNALEALSCLPRFFRLPKSHDSVAMKKSHSYYRCWGSVRLFTYFPFTLLLAMLSNKHQRPAHYKRISAYVSGFSGIN